jgi:RNA polymerase sigma factor (sigma-70 family)
MNTQISFDNIPRDSQPGLEGSIWELIMRHVQRYESRFPRDSVELDVYAAKSRHRAMYMARAQLRLPGATFAAHSEGHDVLPTVRELFDELERDLLRHMGRLRAQDQWRRTEERFELRRLRQAIDAFPERRVEAFGELVRILLPQLQRYAQREMAALRERGDLNPDYPSPQDIVDTVLARAYERLDKRAQDLEPVQWLYQIAHEVLRDEVRGTLRDAGAAVSALSPPPRLHSLDEQDRSVDALWQPDEMLRIDVVAPIAAITPEDTLDEGDLRRVFHRALARMPANWRRAIWLTQAEAIAPPRVAHMLGTTEDQVKRWIGHGDEFLRAHLREAGYELAAQGGAGAWFSQWPVPAAPDLAQAFDAAVPPAP